MTTSNCVISIYLDTRRKTKNGKYPVKLRVFTQYPRVQKLYTTKVALTADEFQKVWESKKPRKEHKPIRSKLSAIEAEATRVADRLSYFTFEAFESELFDTRNSNEKDVNYYYNQAIQQYKRNDQVGTASNYDLSLKSLVDFHGKEKLPFYVISPQWLKDFEKYMIEDKKRSQTTVGIYLRPLRAVFNTAIADNAVNAEQYPFGKRKYNIPAPKGTKKALSKEQLRTMYEAEPGTPEQQKAKAFWFFSYACNGMNFKDIANLQYKDISGDTLTFRRAKTANTNKAQAPVTVYLNDFTKTVIKRYGNTKTNPETYIFTIIDPTADQETNHSRLSNFIRYVNQHFKKFTKNIGIEENVSTYWARHTFATNAIRSGASMEYVSEALSHSNLSTTRNYFAGFEDEKKKEIAEKLMQF